MPGSTSGPTSGPISGAPAPSPSPPTGWADPAPYTSSPNAQTAPLGAGAYRAPTAPLPTGRPMQMPGGPPPLPPGTGPVPAQAPLPPGPASSSTWPAASGPTAEMTVARPQRRSRAALLIGLTALSLIAGLIGGAVVTSVMLRGRTLATTPTGSSPVTLPSVTGSAAPPVRDASSVAGIAAGVLPSVVQIAIESTEGDASGSGFILDTAGHIATNNHVVADADSISVIFQDGAKMKATLVGRDAAYDVAVLKVANIGSRKPLVFGDSEAVVVGDPVIAIGAPLGLQGTVTTGIISAKNRPVSAGKATTNDPATFINAIQTDAAINPGNSGGPLVNSQGQVIGINTAIAQASGGSLSGQSGNIGLGFAVPSNQAKRTAEALITKGKAEYPVIGVNLSQQDYTGEGVKVGTVSAGGPADKAGVRAGDVIISMDGRPVTDSLELIVSIRAKEVGDTVTLGIRRDGKDIQVKVTLVAG